MNVVQGVRPSNIPNKLLTTTGLIVRVIGRLPSNSSYAINNWMHQQ